MPADRPQPDPQLDTQLDTQPDEPLRSPGCAEPVAVPLVPSPQRLRARRVHPDLAELDWPAAMGSINVERVERLKTSEHSSVVRAVLPVEGQRLEVVIKTQTQPSIVDALRCALNATRLDRQWKGAGLLERAEAFPTARCLALLSWQSGDGRRFLSLVLQAVPGRTLLEWMADPPRSSAAQLAMADEVGRSARRMLDAMVFNRDHKPSNLIVTGGEPSLVLVDTVGIGETGARAAEPVRPLASLVTEPLGCGVLPRRALLMRALRAFEPGRSARHRLWRRVEAAVRAHGDPTPKDNPLNASSATA